MSTPSGIQIRPATPDDAPLILRLIQGLAEYEKLSAECIATEQSLRATLFGGRPVAEVLIASLDHEPAGFVLFFHNYSTFLARPGIYIEDLFVLPQHRCRGVGKALLKRVAQVALERDCGRLEWSVLDWNEPAIRFYKSLGAVPMDEWTGYRVTGEALNNLGGKQA